MQDVLTHAIGWAILQFVWQGAAIAALVGVGSLLCRRSPSSRYVVATTGLAAMLAAATVTAVLYVRNEAASLRVGARAGAPSPFFAAIAPVDDLDRQTQDSAVRVTSAPVNNPAEAGSHSPSAPAEAGSHSTSLFRAWPRDRVEQWLPAAVYCWLIGVFALSLNLVRGWFHMARVRRHGTRPVTDEWRSRVTTLADRLGLRRPVRALESALVDVPAVMGTLRPILLLPVGALTGLAPAQLDAVIAHELAHIKRHDYLVNLLQTGAETLLFFHPAVWWVSHRMRVEREHCCDDVAVEICGDPMAYAYALVSLEAQRGATPSLALAATDGSLMARVRRVVGAPPSHQRAAAWPFGGVALLLGVIGLFLMGFLSQSASTAPPDLEAPARQTAQDSAVARPPGVAPLQASARDNAGPQSGTATIRGRVLTADGAPIRRAQVLLKDTAAPATTGPGRGAGPVAASDAMAATDEQGRYELTGLPPGRHTLTASKTGYLTLSYGQRRPREVAKPVDLADGQTLEQIDFRLPKGSVIAVHVTDDLGDPMAGALVQAEYYAFADGVRRLAADVSARTDDRGDVRLSGVTPGDYYISADLVSGGRSSVMAASDSGQRYALTYSPGTPTLRDAQRVSIGVAEEKTVSFPLVASRVSRVNGIVRGSTGAPPAGHNYTLRNIGGTSMAVTGVNFVPLAADGSFTLPNLVPGEYDLRILPGISVPADSPAREWALVPITVSGVDVSDLVVTTARAASFRGQIIFDGGAPPAGLRPLLVQLAIAFAGSPLASGRFTTNDDWTFDAADVRGVGMLTLRAPVNGWFLKAVMVDGKDMTDAHVEFTSATVLKDLQVVLTQKRSKVSGNATDSRGAAVRDYVAVVFGDERNQWTPKSRFVAAGRSDQQGQFTITGLPPGRYLAAAVEYLPVGQEQDPDLLARLQASATRLTLGEGASTTVSLKMTPY